MKFAPTAIVSGIEPEHRPSPRPLTNDFETHLLCPQSEPVALVLEAPMLPIVWFPQVQRLRRPVGGRERNEDVAVFARLWRWAGRPVYKLASSHRRGWWVARRT